MTQPTDGNSEAGVQGVPTPVISSASGGQGSAASTSDVQALRQSIKAELLAEFAPLIEKGIQSTKDKRFRDLEEIRAQMLSNKAYLDKNNGDASLAAREMAIDEMLTSQGSAGRTPPTGEQVSFQDTTTAKLVKAGIAFDDPEVLAWAATEVATETQGLLKLDALIQRRITQPQTQTPPPQQAPSTGTPVFDGGGRTPARKDPAQELATLDDQLLVLYKEPSVNMNKITELQKRRSELVA